MSITKRGPRSIRDWRDSVIDAAIFGLFNAIVVQLLALLLDLSGLVT